MRGERVRRLLAVVIARARSLRPFAAQASAARSRRRRRSTIWADQDRKAAVTKVANAWASARGVDVEVVVQKTSATSATTSGRSTPRDAPDVIIGAHDWTGELAANGLVVAALPERGDARSSSRSTRSTRSRTAPR